MKKTFGHWSMLLQRTSLRLGGAILTVFTTLAAGQEPQPPAEPPASQPAPAAANAATALESGTTPTSATVEKIMEEAVKNISRRYNLNEA
ncbi:MAG: hypothetical protein AAB363_00060, partial [Planctomycetota bacterium]